MLEKLSMDEHTSLFLPLVSDEQNLIVTLKKLFTFFFIAMGK